ncbi:CGGC domain-containing protein [Phaeovibrio sulfidiphilus]|uniref:CGGC domain-containing protein n=1 Tax=Phaeovibrio sulfidiphilus TaxID=1220600 RepID=A0A8J7CQH2_9PROT|nr:CGGC domain-containing protein [Phaeovibrio sulfidiphilus]MBE1236825.1 CGGC domain-containing protein [Phaeovibrio sulfidiphilus]
MVKVGIIRCQQTEDTCPGTSCFVARDHGAAHFQPLGETSVVGFVSCGGCSGRRAVQRAQLLARKGAEVIMLSTCMVRGSYGGTMTCPYIGPMREAIERVTGLPIVNGTH